MFGVVMQLQQSSVGKTLLSVIILPPMLASFSTKRHLVALVGQVERRLHAGDPAAHNQRVYLQSSLKPSLTSQAAS